MNWLIWNYTRIKRLFIIGRSNQIEIHGMWVNYASIECFHYIFISNHIVLSSMILFFFSLLIRIGVLTNNKKPSIGIKDWAYLSIRNQFVSKYSCVHFEMAMWLTEKWCYWKEIVLNIPIAHGFINTFQMLNEC